MPTIIVDKAKGLFQKAGTTQNPAGSFAGAKSVVFPTVINGVAAHTASLNDSGKSFILGTTGGRSLALPEMTAANIGWNCELIVTGALSSTHVIATVNTSGESADSDRFLLAAAAGTAAEVAKVTTGADNELDFLTGCADADDMCVIEVRYIGANKAIAKGVSLA